MKNTAFNLLNLELNMSNDTNTWPELAENLYQRLTERGAEISYTYEDFEVDIPSSTGDASKSARWKMNGTLKITTQDRS